MLEDSYYTEEYIDELNQEVKDEQINDYYSLLSDD
jgi:hypothetical protein